MRRDRISSVSLTARLPLAATRSSRCCRPRPAAGTRAPPTRRSLAPASRGEQRLEVERPGPRRPPPGRVGDLDVQDRLPVPAEHVSHVFPHLRQVVQVREEPDVGRAHLFDHRHGLGAAVDREPGDVHGVDRLDEHRRPDLPRRLAPRTPGSRPRRRPAPRRQPPAPAARTARSAACTPSAPRSPRAAATFSRNSRRPARMRHDPALPGRHVPGVEVQRNQLDPGVSDRPDERVGLGVGRRHARPRPPELNPAEPGRLGGAGRAGPAAVR